MRPGLGKRTDANILTLDDLMATLTIGGLAGLLSYDRLRDLTEFNGLPVIHYKLDTGLMWRAEQISGEHVEWEGMHAHVTSIGRNNTGRDKFVEYSEIGGQVIVFRGSSVRYVTDHVEGGPTKLFELNGNSVVFDLQQKLVGINGATVSYDEGLTGLNGYSVDYGKKGVITSINGQSVTCKPGEKRPSNKDILLLAALFPPPISLRMNLPETMYQKRVA